MRYLYLLILLAALVSMGVSHHFSARAEEQLLEAHETLDKASTLEEHAELLTADAKSNVAMAQEWWDQAHQILAKARARRNCIQIPKGRLAGGVR